ncbi:MAG: DUF2520 domain-containing protein [Gemmatimonadales bacterium]
MTPPGYAILGDGRVARHLAHYFGLEGITLSAWSRRAERELGAPLAGAVANADVVLLAVADDAIASVAARPELAGRTLVHFAGALTLPSVAGLHPLMTFGPALLTHEEYRAIPFIGESGRPSFTTLFPHLPNPSFAIDPARKARYHALATLAGGLPPLVWEHFLRALTDAGIPASAAGPYLDAVMRRIRGPMPFPVTGPAVRGDLGTVAVHREALAGHPAADLYDAFVRAIQPGPGEP